MDHDHVARYGIRPHFFKGKTASCKRSKQLLVHFLTIYFPGENGQTFKLENQQIGIDFGTKNGAVM